MRVPQDQPAELDVASGVLGAAAPRPELDPEGEYVYVAARHGGRMDDAQVEFRVVSGGLRALMVYRTLERLVECCGTGQEWVLVAAEDVSTCQRAAGLDVVLWDTPLLASERKELDD